MGFGDNRFFLVIIAILCLLVVYIIGAAWGIFPMPEELIEMIFGPQYYS